MSQPPDDFWGMTGSILKRLDAQARQKKETPQDPGGDAASHPENQTASAISSPKLSQEASSIHRLAVLYHSQLKYGEAERLYQKGRVLLESAAVRNNPELASLLNNLGRLYFEQNRYAEAEPLLRRSLEMAEAIFGKDHLKVARRLANMAALSLATGRFTEADSLYHRALTIEERELGLQHSDTVKTSRTYVAMLRQLNNLAKAEAVAAYFFILRSVQDRRVVGERRATDRRSMGRAGTEGNRRHRRDRRLIMVRRASAASPIRR